MQAFYDARQALHAPTSEMHNGGFVAYREHPGRVASVLAAIPNMLAPADLGLGPIAAVHDAGYLDFLRTGHDAWLAAGRSGEALPYAWPVVARRDLRLRRIDALLGRYSFDATTPLTAQTWTAAYASAQTALAAAQAVIAGERCAFALCRPPGHHAGRDYMGGYCYLNVAAIAAQHARDAGAARVAILDIDYHHGNGTQDLFWDRGDMFYASIHADPATDYPFFWGHADEIGAAGGRGATLNLPLPQGAGLAEVREALGQALAAITAFRADFLVVSYGADTFEHDPICSFAVTTRDYAVLAANIAGLGLPTAIILEGGYAVDQLGANVASFLSGFEGEGRAA